MASARDELDTVPPPAGEDDAYSAATKVGAMPADLMARLRAEGLLPEEDKVEPRPPPPRPATNLASRPTPPAPAPRSQFDDVPVLSSEPPPPADSYSPFPAATHAASVDEGSPASLRDVPRAAGTPAPASLETPVAFATPPSTAPDPAIAQEPAPLSGRSAEAVRAFGGRSQKLKSTIILVAVLIALVAFAFVMALLSQRR